jgi:hypothetical protein
LEPHLSADDIAALVDGDVPPDRRAAVEAHLSVCGECRSELVAASELVDSVPAKSRIPIRWFAGVAAAVALIAIVPWVRNRSAPSPNEAVRSSASSLASIQTVGPAPGMNAAADSLTFSWRPLPGVMTYHVFVTDSAGAPVYNLTTTDTVVGPIADVHLSPGSRYFWYVDALRRDGSSVTSAQISFFVHDR